MMDKATGLRIHQIRNFNRFYTNIIGLVNQNILESPYSLAEGRILLEINNTEKCTASDIVKILQIDPGYLSRILRRFKKEELIAATRSAMDGRVQIVELTEKGKATFSQLSAASDLQLAQILKSVSQGEQQQLVSHMTAIQTILSKKPSSSITIRNYKPGDAGYIAYRHSVLYAQEYGFGQVFEEYVIKSLEKFLENPSGSQIWMAESGDTIIGFIAIVKIDAATAQLRWFLIEPEFRGIGLGRNLVATALDYCRQCNYKQVFLWTFKGLDSARHLYEAYGFTLTEEEETNTWMNHLIEQRWDIRLDD
jgi:DNA-binding MarR family transcriptional regulator/GNAT superfamily N-acetyltransferase